MAEQANNPFGGLFSTTVTRDELESERRKDLHTSAVQQRRDYISQGKYGLAASVGIDEQASKYRKDLVTSDEDKMLKVRDNVNASMANLIKDKETWKGMSDFEKQMAQGAIQAQEFMKEGLYQQGGQVLKQLQEARMLQDKQTLENEKLGYETEKSRQGVVQSKILNRKGKFDLANMIKGEQVMVYDKDSDDPNSGHLAWIDPDTGEAKIDENTALPAGTFSIVRPMAMKGAGADGDDPDAWAPNKREQAEIRKQAAGLMRQMDTSIAMVDSLEGLRNPATGQYDLMGASGDIALGAKHIVDNVKHVASIAGKALGITGTGITLMGYDDKPVGRYDGGEKSATRLLESDNFEDLDDDLDRIIEGFEEEGHRISNVAVWKANVVRLAYARALAREPGGRQLSDQDFKTAVREIAGSATNPEEFKKVILSGMTQDVQSFRDSMALLPERYRNKILQDGGRRIEEKYSLMQEKFQLAPSDSDRRGSIERTPEQQSDLDITNSILEELQQLPTGP